MGNPAKIEDAKKAISRPRAKLLGGALLGAAVIGGLAVVNRRKARAEESKYPPRGPWISIGDTSLHYIVKGEGPAVLLIHGNLATAEDFVACGLVDRLAERHRVYVFDRPGYGYSSRPGRLWTPSDYAKQLAQALQTLGVERAAVVGHSFGTLVAMALALDFPDLVERLVLLSGYFYPSFRLDVPLLSPPAIPLLGDAMRLTVSPILLRLMQPTLFRILFAPAEPTAEFNRRFPSGLAIRPLQIRAQAEDAMVMVPATALHERRYGDLKSAVSILAGADDCWVDARAQSARLHDDVPHSRLRLLPGVGHMIHYLALEEVVAAIEDSRELKRFPSLHAAREVSPRP